MRMDLCAENRRTAAGWQTDSNRLFRSRYRQEQSGDGKSAQRRTHTAGRLENVGPPVNTTDHGPYVLTLKPAPDTLTFGRGGFLLHGDSKESPGCASHGCVISPLELRERARQSGA